METKFVSWNRKDGYEKDALLQLAEILRSGGLVAFPTETVYGLGGNGLMKEAAQKIYEAKGRPSDNPLILHISKREELDAIAKGITP
ncbi:MAG: Sua5/YciO/YrdC/YwlC family protein, partial [Eubacterium sp.]|nr:Sua5/YciO/YrdC/YwlC family protein [Eubacterium sp.]